MCGVRTWSWEQIWAQLSFFFVCQSFRVIVKTSQGSGLVEFQVRFGFSLGGWGVWGLLPIAGRVVLQMKGRLQIYARLVLRLLVMLGLRPSLVLPSQTLYVMTHVGRLPWRLPGICCEHQSWNHVGFQLNVSVPAVKRYREGKNVTSKSSLRMKLIHQTNSIAIFFFPIIVESSPALTPGTLVAAYVGCTRK